AHDLVGGREEHDGRDGGEGEGARLCVPRDHRPLALPARREARAPGRGAGRPERAAEALSAPPRDRGQHPRERDARRRRRGAGRDGLGGRLDPRGVLDQPDGAGAGGDGEPARRRDRPPDGPQAQQARPDGFRPRAGLCRCRRDRHRARDQLAAGPARPPRRRRAPGRAARCPARRLDGRPLRRRARLRDARHRPGAARVADEGAGREHAAVVEGQGEEVTTFREDGHAAVDWAADYLERVGELPVLAQVKPGEVRARLQASPPEQGEPFAAVLRDLDEVLLPGITHWQHPRFFAYFAVSAAEPGILAELLAATLNSVAILWRTAPAATELEVTVLDWVAQLLGIPRAWHGHIEDTASTSTLAALVAARQATRRNVVVCSEHAHSSSWTTSLPSSPPSGRRRPRPSIPSPRSPSAAQPPARGSTSTPPTPARRWCARSSAGRSRASSAPIPSSSTHTSGCSRRWTARSSGRAAPTSSGRRSRSCPSTCGRPTRPRSTSASTAPRSAAGSGR